MKTRRVTVLGLQGSGIFLKHWKYVNELFLPCIQYSRDSHHLCPTIVARETHDDLDYCSSGCRGLPVIQSTGFRLFPVPSCRFVFRVYLASMAGEPVFSGTNNMTINSLSTGGPALLQPSSAVHAIVTCHFILRHFCHWGLQIALFPEPSPWPYRQGWPYQELYLQTALFLGSLEHTRFTTHTHTQPLF